MVGILVSYFGLALAGGATFLVWDRLASLSTPMRVRMSGASSGVIARNLVLGLQVLVIVTVATFFHKAPEFVYRAF